jgi:hypothetical protein
MAMTRKTYLRILFWLVILTCAVIAVRGRAQAVADQHVSKSRWVGVWQGQLEGVPGVVLTLSDDLETLDGTIVFTVLGPGSTMEHPNMVGHEVHAIMHPKVSADKLSFQIKSLEHSSETLEMTFELTSASKGQLQCLKCGPAPATEMNRLE